MIRSRQLAYRYADGPELRFDDVTVPQGGLLLLRGASGSGKSTWLALAAGLLAATNGDITVAGQSLRALGKVAGDAWRAKTIGFATPNIGLLTDIIACPGGDFCSLANAKSIPVAEAIQRRFDDLDYLFDIGDIAINISGCMNACGHHHVGHIGILGVDKHGAEFYQVTIGGSQGLQAALGKVIGPSFAQDEMADVVEKLIKTYVALRHEDEHFLDTAKRVGMEPFKTSVYDKKAGRHEAEVAHV